MPTSKEDLQSRGIPLHDTQHHQHRRADWQDYGGVGLYMVTLCIEGRHPLFGQLQGNIRAARDSADFPHLVQSPLGRAIIAEELPKIHRYYPQIKVWKAALMPDHLHLLLYVSAPLPDGKKLGDILRRFKGGCSRAWWAQLDAAKAAQTARAAQGTQAAETALTAPNGAGTTAQGTTAPPPSSSSSSQGQTPPPSSSSQGQTPPPSSSSSPSSSSPPSSGLQAVVPVLSSTVKRPSLFEPGYHDRIIKRPGMLDTIKRYMADNPLRALMRRQLPHLLERRLHLRVGTHDYAAFGALFLLKRAEKEQIFYHRKDKKTGKKTELLDSFKQSRARQLAEAREGVVLVSPAISTPERLVIDAAIDEGLPVINLQKEPITRYWKPERRRFEACARGALLILAPWGLDEEIMRTAANATGTTASTSSRPTTASPSPSSPSSSSPSVPSDYARFHHLNDLAAEICATTDVVLLDMKDIMAE